MEILGMDVSVTWVLVTGLITLTAWYDWWSHHYFQRLGIPVADYIPIFGNLLQWRYGFHQTFADFAKKYGKVFGMYEFRKPVLIVTDPEIIRKMCIKNFSSFINRKTLPLCQQPRDKGLTRLKGQEWKEVRNVVMPSFSASKMRLMSPLINGCGDSLVANINKAQTGGKSVDCREIFGSFAMDASALCGFGLEVDSQKNKDDPLVEHARKAVDFFLYNPARLICGIFPILRPIFDYFDFGVFDSKAVDFFTALTNDTCKLRRQEGKSASQRIDILQLMLNAHGETGDERTNSTKEGASTRRALTADEILAQSIIFFFAGYETVSALLIFVTYAMATNPDIQEKLHAEIDDSAPTRDSLNYDVIFKMEYLDKVVSETLRMYPPGAVFDRFCNETVTYNGLTIEKGVTIMVSVWTIHHNEEYWPNPSKFDPERFSPENKESIQPCTYLPFGVGPRNCAGMRYALLVTKMAVLRVMQNFRFEVSPETQIPLQLGKVGLAPKNLFVRMVPRKK
ncbi:cytochrome P450 3A24-like [Asterias rubens]|uniref:cytochrome P450 3A24-like n=1 Tax=Asterias rubens TaxID=7604 RepID=UPI0014557648|nr:cytochrome P450 3A24-like [Asterias rubens]